MNIWNKLVQLKRSPKLNPTLRTMINSAFYDPNYVAINMKNFDKLLSDGFVWEINSQVDSVQKVKGNSWFKYIRDTDTVVDIGANIGAISIPLAKVAKKVIAIEPLFFMELERNSYLNKVREKILVVPKALGSFDGSMLEVQFAERRLIVETISWQQLKSLADNRIDFLKCDIEGAEFDYLNLVSDLEGIREFRFEFHIRKSSYESDFTKMQVFSKWLLNNNYTATWTKIDQRGLLIPYKEYWLLNAGKER